MGNTRLTEAFNLEQEIKILLRLKATKGKLPLRRYRALKNKLQRYTRLHPYHHFFKNQPVKALQVNLSDETKKNHQSHCLFNDHIQLINHFNRDKIELTAYLNFFNQANSIYNQPIHCQTKLDAQQIESLSLSALNIFILTYRLSILLLWYFDENHTDLTLNKIWEEYQYIIISDTLWLGINISGLILSFLNLSAYFTPIPVIGFSVDVALWWLNKVHLKEHHHREQWHLMGQYVAKTKNQNLFNDWCLHSYQERITFLTQLYKNQEKNLSMQMLILSMLVNEQHYQLEQAKILVHLFASLLTLIAYVIIQVTIGTHFLSLQMSLQLALLSSIAVVYTCSALRDVLVNEILPEWTRNDIELEEDVYLSNGLISKRKHETTGQSSPLQILKELIFKLAIPAIAIILLTQTALPFEFVLGIFVGMITPYILAAKFGEYFLASNANNSPSASLRVAV